MVYRASAWHEPGDTKPVGVARQLQGLQSGCLCTVTGAYKATQIRHLEIEAAVPPLDLYLNQKVADFEARLETTGMSQLIRNTCSVIASQLRRRRTRRRPPRPPPLPLSRTELRAQWAHNWCGAQGPDSTATPV